MTVTGHVPTGMTAPQVVEIGFDGIAHMQLRGQPGSDQAKQLLEFFKLHNTVMDRQRQTLAVLFRIPISGSGEATRLIG